MVPPPPSAAPKQRESKVPRGGGRWTVSLEFDEVPDHVWTVARAPKSVSNNLGGGLFKKKHDWERNKYGLLLRE